MEDPKDTRMSGRVASMALRVMFIFVGVMVWIS